MNRIQLALPPFVQHLHLEIEAVIAIAGILLVLVLRILTRDGTARRALARTALYLVGFLLLFVATVAVEPSRANLENLLDTARVGPRSTLTVRLDPGAYTAIMAGTGQVTYTAGSAGTAGLPCSNTAANECQFTVNVGGTVLATVASDATHPVAVKKLVRTPDEALAKLLGVLAAIVFLLGAFRLAGAVFFDVFLLLRRKVEVPRILRDIATVVGWAIGLAIIMNAVGPPGLFHDILATYGIIGAIVGFAVQAPLGNLFGGLVLELERPFNLGDRISLGDLSGEVVDTTWRSTKIRAGANDLVVVPNSTLLNGTIVNHRPPRPPVELTVSVALSCNVSPAHAKRSLIAAAHADRRVLPEPPPAAFLRAFGDQALQYDLTFSVPAGTDARTVTDRVQTAAWFRFHREGIPISGTTPAPGAPAVGGLSGRSEEEILAFLEGVDLLRPLSDEERRKLAAAGRTEWYAEGEIITHTGEVGATGYLLMEGTLRRHSGSLQAALAEDAAAGEILEPGAIFGEMSLLTGDPRDATVIADRPSQVLAIDRAPFREILAANKEVLATLSAILARRNAERDAARKQAAPPSEEHVASQSSALLDRITSFFGFELTMYPPPAPRGEGQGGGY